MSYSGVLDTAWLNKFWNEEFSFNGSESISIGRRVSKVVISISLGPMYMELYFLKVQKMLAVREKNHTHNEVDK